jgi:hypothetical protein
MCDNVIIHYLNGREKTCETQFELHQAMVNGLVLFNPLMWVGKMGEWDGRLDPDYYLEYGFDWDCCLCPIDLDETAKRNGFICTKRCLEGTKWEMDAFDTHFYELKFPEAEDYNINLTHYLEWVQEQHWLSFMAGHYIKDRWIQVPDFNLAEMMDAIQNRVWVKERP